jgi:uncharacterized membrane protein YedE/YeeE
MKRDFVAVLIGVIACLAFTFLFHLILDNRESREMEWISAQGPLVFIAGVLVALLLKTSRDTKI